MIEPEPAIEVVTYEQCKYDWEHVSQIYRKINAEPDEASGGWNVQDSSEDSECRYRRFGGYFQFFCGDPRTSLFQQFLSFEPMPTYDDAEWVIEKHGEHEYLTRTSFTETFGPSPQIQRLDELLEPFGLWLENRGKYVSGAATFGSLTSDKMWLACRRIVMLERWCLEANRLVTETLDGYWGNVLEQVQREIRGEGEPVLLYDASPSGAKRREPFSGALDGGLNKC